METLLNSETSLLEKMEVFNCLTTFQCAQLSQLKQWSLLHANQAVVPQATPVPGFERLMLLPQMFEQDIPAFTKPTFGLTQKKSFLDDLSDVDDLFNGPSDCSMFNLNPEKDIDQVPDRTGFDEFLDEVLSEQGSYTPSITPSVTKNEEITQESYDLVHSQPNSPLYSQPSGPLYSQSFHSQPNSPLQSQPRSPTQSECNNSLHNQPNSPFQSQPNSPYHSQPNSPTQSHSQLDSPYYSQPNSPLHSQPNSPLDNPLNSLSCSPPVSPVSPSISEAGSNTYSTDEGIGSQSDISECGDDVFFSVSSPISDGTEQQLLPFIKQEPDILSTKTGRRKRGPRPQVKYTGDGPMQLWQFLLELLIAPEYSKLVKWTQDEDYEFKILKPSQVAKMWGEKKNKPTMNYEKLSRGLRYYYGKSVIEKVHGKRYVYLFKCDIPKILGYDPMVTIKGEDCVEDSVCGEPIMSPKVEDLLVTSSAEDGTLAFL